MRRVSKSIGRVLLFAVISSIVILALAVYVMLISAHLDSAQIQAAVFVQYQLDNEDTIKDDIALESTKMTRNFKSKLFMDFQISF